MLVLTRKRGEEIVIDENITISIVRIRGNAVQIGIQAPSQVPIRRSELSSQPPSEPTPEAAK